MQALFVDASRTLFKAKSIVYMVAASHNDILGYEDFSKERDKLKERCEVLLRENSEVGKELIIM